VDNGKTLKEREMQQEIYVAKKIKDL